MDVEFEEVEEFVRYEGDGAVYFAFVAKREMQRGLRLGADRKRDILEVAGCVYDLHGLLVCLL